MSPRTRLSSRASQSSRRRKVPSKAKVKSSESEKEEEPSPKSKSVVYKKDPNLPPGWRVYDTGKGNALFKDRKGRRFSSRRKVLAHMYNNLSKFSKEFIYYIRDGLLDEGWFYHQDLPPGWMFKHYNHKIEGVYTNILYLMSPNGSLFRSKIKIKRQAQELGLSPEDLQQLLDFKSELFDEPKKVDDPDSDWVYDEEFVPKGWRRKRYSYNSGITKKTEEVYHYLTPDKTVIRGKKQVYDYMLRTGTFSMEEYSKFHFNQKNNNFIVDGRLTRRRNKVDWGEWDLAEDIGEGWMSRYCYYRSQRKVQFKAPDGRKFQSRVLAMKYVHGGDVQEPKAFSIKTRRSVKNIDPRESYTPAVLNSNFPTKWDDWRDDEIPCLTGWKFSIGRRGNKRKIRYKSPSGDIFRSRGTLLRHLKENSLKSKEQLAILKKQLKINQGLPVHELLKNDKFIKNFDADTNYLEFLKVRYENESHSHIPEEVDPKLPDGWVKKTINGVDYFKDPTGYHVFNSRRLVVEHLRRDYYDLTNEELQDILDDSETDSDLSDSEEESEGAAKANEENEDSDADEVFDDEGVEEEEENNNFDDTQIEFVLC